MAKALKEPTIAVIHRTESDRSSHDNFKTINDWHKRRGFSCKLDNGELIHIGYHVLILKNGNICWGRPLDKRGAHCYGFNGKSIGICLSGKNQFTAVQKRSLTLVLAEIEDYLGYKLERFGHFELDRRPEKRHCPNVPSDWYK
jgi:N-acetylmuramoyl-L-alanine amidase